MIDPVRNGSGARHHDQPCGPPGPGHECDEGVVHDERPLAKSQPAHHASRGGRVVGAVHAGHAKADRDRRLGAGRKRLIDDLVQGLLHRELAVRPQVRPAGTCFGDDAAVGADHPLTIESGHHLFRSAQVRFDEHLDVLIPAVSGE